MSDHIEHFINCLTSTLVCQAGAGKASTDVSALFGGHVGEIILYATQN